MRALPGDKIDIVRWSDSEKDFIRNLLGGSKVERIALDAATQRATVTVSTDITSRLTEDGAIRLRLASRLAGWDLELVKE